MNLTIRWDAVNWLENQGFDKEAVEHYLEGKQVQDAVRLIEKNLHTLVQTKSVVLIRGVSVLPENSFAEKPMIELFYIAVLLGVGELKVAFRRVEQATIRFQTLKQKLTDVECKKDMGNIYFFCAIISYLQKDLERTSDCFEQVEQYMPEGSFFQTMGAQQISRYDTSDDLLAHINDLHAADVFLLRLAFCLMESNMGVFGSLLGSISMIAMFVKRFVSYVKNNAFPQPLSEKDESKYLQLMAEGDGNVRNMLIEHNLRLVAHIVKTL